MVVKGIGEEYLEKTGMTAEQIATDISDEINETVNTITIVSAGWDAWIGYYAAVRTARNRYWIINNGKVFRGNSWYKERSMY